MHAALSAQVYSALVGVGRSDASKATACEEGPMGATVSALVFQPPLPTYGYTRRYFFLATALNNRIPAFFIAHE